MSTTVATVLTLSAGIAAGLAAHLARVPGGAILGALIGVGALKLALGDIPAVPDEIRITAQVLIGTAIGANLSRRPLAAIRTAGGRVLPLLFALLAVAAACGFAFAYVTDLSLLTTVFSTAPGGASDMTAAALEFNTDAALIAGFHLLRQLAILVVIASVFERLLRGIPPDT